MFFRCHAACLNPVLFSIIVCFQCVFFALMSSLDSVFNSPFLSDDNMFVSSHLRLVQYLLCSVYIHVNQAS